MNFSRLMQRGFLAGVAGVALLPAVAFAQDTADEGSAPDKDIVVTGTLLRGQAPVGANAITLDAARMESIGATSSNELLASIPQVTNYFNRVPVSDLAIAVNQIQVSRPNLRNISGTNAASSATLVLVDGHRIASVGVNQASVDPDLIPTGAIERIEVATEGGSATYGADAVAGVINFITKKRFDGIKVNGSYGIADNYWQWDAGVTVGKAWDTGSIYASYTYTKNDALYGRDRDFIRRVDYSREPYQGLGRSCASPNLAINTVYVPANFTLASVNYAGPNYLPGTFNACDDSDNSSIVPKAERHGAIVSLNQELGDRTSIDVRGFFGQRTTKAYDVLAGVVNVGANNPHAAPYLPAGVILGGSVVATRAAVSFSMEPLLGLDSKHSNTKIREYGVNAEVKHDIDDNWQIRALANWSTSDSRYSLTQFSPTRLAAAGAASTAAAAFNPFDVTKNNSALIADLIDSAIAGQAKDTLLDLRAIAEGKLFDLPAGEVRLAVGYEFMHDKLKQRFQNDVRIGQLGSFPFTAYSRDVHAVFGELQAPVLAHDDGSEMLVLSAQGRYDHYSDFGDTFNPKFGASFSPTPGFKLRGNWGTSFTAPTPLDQLGSLRNTISSFPFVAFLKPGDPSQPGAFTVALQGSQPNLKPQKADTWSVGIDIDPPTWPGFHASVSYFDVKFKNILRTPTPNSGIFAQYPNNIISSVDGLTAEQLRAFGALAPGGSTVVESLIASGTKVYEAVDFRTGNFGILHVKGVDFNVNYRQAVGADASIDLAVNGNLQLTRDSQASPTSPVLDDADGEYSPFFLQTALGTDIGGFRAQVTWNHNEGYDIVKTTGLYPQDHVGSFDTVNLFFKYDVPADSGILQDLAFTFNVNNVFDQDPPVLRRNNQSENGYANGFTLGRMFIIGASKKF